MIISQGKLEDMQARELMLEGMELMLKFGHMEEAKFAGECSAKMKEKIDTKDYTFTDEVIRKTQRI